MRDRIPDVIRRIILRRPHSASDTRAECAGSRGASVASEPRMVDRDPCGTAMRGLHPTGHRLFSMLGKVSRVMSHPRSRSLSAPVRVLLGEGDRRLVGDGVHDAFSRMTNRVVGSFTGKRRRCEFWWPDQRFRRTFSPLTSTPQPQDSHRRITRFEFQQLRNRGSSSSQSGHFLRGINRTIRSGPRTPATMPPTMPPNTPGGRSTAALHASSGSNHVESLPPTCFTRSTPSPQANFANSPPRRQPETHQAQSEECVENQRERHETDNRLASCGAAMRGLPPPQGVACSPCSGRWACS